MPDFHHQKSSFRIKADDDDKFLSKLLSKDSKCNPSSFRVYYGDVSSAVPFTWETRPGTPKHDVSCENPDIPPLTPPPSYFSNKLLNTTNSNNNKSSRSTNKFLFFHTLLRRVTTKKTKFFFAPPPAADSLSCSSSSSHYSSFSDPPPYFRKRRRFSSWGSSMSFDGDDRPSWMCFGRRSAAQG